LAWATGKGGGYFLGLTHSKIFSASPKKGLCADSDRLAEWEKSKGLAAKSKPGGGGGNWTGCANTRSTLWTYVHSRIEPQTLKGQSYTGVQQELREYFVGRAFEANGIKKRGGQLADARNATARKLADLMFRELYINCGLSIWQRAAIAPRRSRTCSASISLVSVTLPIFFAGSVGSRVAPGLTSTMSTASSTR